MRFTRSDFINALLILGICWAVSALACRCHERQPIIIHIDGERVI